MPQLHTEGTPTISEALFGKENDSKVCMSTYVVFAKLFNTKNTFTMFLFLGEFDRIVNSEIFGDNLLVLTS